MGGPLFHECVVTWDHVVSENVNFPDACHIHLEVSKEENEEQRKGKQEERIARKMMGEGGREGALLFCSLYSGYLSSVLPGCDLDVI